MAVAALGLVLQAGCGSGAASPADAGPGTDGTPVADGGLPGDGAAGDEVEIVIFHTGDEHGWLEPSTDESTGLVRGGVANFRARLLDLEGFDPAEHLLLSSGDSWTGPAISGWFDGESTVEAMNLLGYHAAAMGNHEVDFGFEVLDQRLIQANYPMLAANVTDAATGALLPRMLPYELFEVRGVTVGVLGLLTLRAERDVERVAEEDLDFAQLVDSLDDQVPAMREAGAEVIVVAAHECQDYLVAALNTASVSVDVAFGGHCHQLGYDTAAGAVTVFSGSYWEHYSVVTLTYDRGAGRVVAAEVRQEELAYDSAVGNPVTPDPAMETLVAEWRADLDVMLGEEIGYTATGFELKSWPMANWTADAWLWAFPSADLVIQVLGGFKADVAPGAVTIEEIVTMMPFGNTIVMMELTGAEVVTSLEAHASSCAPGSACAVMVGGMRYVWEAPNVSVFLDSGDPIDPTATYQVLTTDYVFDGAGKFELAQYDPEPWMTAVSYRQPVIDWTRAHATSETTPLESLIDHTPRNE